MPVLHLYVNSAILPFWCERKEIDAGIVARILTGYQAEKRQFGFNELLGTFCRGAGIEAHHYALRGCASMNHARVGRPVRITLIPQSNVSSASTAARS